MRLRGGMGVVVDDERARAYCGAGDRWRRRGEPRGRR